MPRFPWAGPARCQRRHHQPERPGLAPSDEAGYITGAIIPVDGGLTAWSGMPNMPRVLGMV